MDGVTGNDAGPLFQDPRNHRNSRGPADKENGVTSRYKTWKDRVSDGRLIDRPYRPQFTWGWMDSNQVGIFRFMLVGIGLITLMTFRPQGIFGSREEMALDAR